MSKLKDTNAEFKQIVTLIEESRNRAFHKVNEELVLLYFKVRRFVSEKVTAGKWGENTVQELANYIQTQMPGLRGFNRRGLYRMKQFFEAYSDNQFLSTVSTLLKTIDNKQNKIVSALPTLLEKNKKQNPKVSLLPTLLNNPMAFQFKFLDNILAQISWTNHLEILSATKSVARNTSPAIIAEYETKLIPKNIQANKLHQLVELLSKDGGG